jgi:hypothetical protein
VQKCSVLQVDVKGDVLPVPPIFRPGAQPADLAASTEVEDMFRSRWCRIPAHVLHVRTGRPAVAVGDGLDGSVGWVLAGVRAPAGVILDVRRPYAPDDWLD